MAETPSNPVQQTRQVESLRPHNVDVRNYQPPHERYLGIHSRFLIDKGELKRPRLQVVEFGAGPYEAFHRRANVVALRGGTYTALDLDPQIAESARQRADVQREKQTGQVVISQGNSNEDFLTWELLWKVRTLPLLTLLPPMRPLLSAKQCLQN